MNALDIITLAILAATVLICAIKGFLKIVLKTGAIAISAILAKFFGPKVGALLVPALVKSSDKISVDAAQRLSSIISNTVGVVLLFVVLFIVLRFLSGLISKIVTKVTHTGKIDRVLGAIFGLILGVAITFVFAGAVNICASIVSAVNPSAAIIDTIEATKIFKYFLTF